MWMIFQLQRSESISLTWIEEENPEEEAVEVSQATQGRNPRTEANPSTKNLGATHTEGEQGEDDSDKTESDKPTVEENPEVEDDHDTDEEMQEEETLEETTTGSSRKREAVASTHTNTDFVVSAPHSGLSHHCGRYVGMCSQVEIHRS
jgi:hypothetical protein